MKKRVRIDSAIMSIAIIMTGFLYLFPGLYPRSHGLDTLLNCVGILMILKGTFLRMVARGHKKAHSLAGHGLVTSGIYEYTRNPMYLGSFTIGGGFALLAWPWWAFPVFAVLFYTRFKKQVMKEEEHLQKLFGKDYEEYCRRTPRIFPRWSKLIKMDASRALNWEEAWSTKEKRGLLTFTGAALILEILQQKIIFGSANIFGTVGLFAVMILVFGLGLALRYQDWS